MRLIKYIKETWFQIAIIIAYIATCFAFLSSCEFETTNDRIVSEVLSDYSSANIRSFPRNGVNMYDFESNRFRLDVYCYRIDSLMVAPNYYKENMIREKWSLFICDKEDNSKSSHMTIFFDFYNNSISGSTEQLVIDVCRKLNIDYEIDIINGSSDTTKIIRVR